MTFHIPETQSRMLAGKVGLVTGIVNDQSIAFGCAPGPCATPEQALR